MAIVRLLYINHGRHGSWTANSQVPTLPACSLGDENRQRVWRSTGAGTCDYAAVNVCSTSLSVDRVAFVSFNFTSCAFLGIEGDCTSAFASASLFATCFAPWHAGRSNVVFADLSARQTGKLWWRFVVCDTGNDDGYYEGGVFALGQAACMVIDAGDPSITYRVINPSITEYAPAGTPKTYRRAPYVLVDLPHRFLSESLVFDTGGGLQDVIRSGEDMVLSLFTSAPACSCMAVATNLYGRIVESPSFTWQIPSRWNGAFQFRESL